MKVDPQPKQNINNNYKIVILKDYHLEGKVILQFGKTVSADSVIHAEVLTSWEVLLVAPASQWTLSHSFMFKSDFKSIVAWVTNPSGAP